MSSVGVGGVVEKILCDGLSFRNNVFMPLGVSVAVQKMPRDAISFINVSYVALSIVLCMPFGDISVAMVEKIPCDAKSLTAVVGVPFRAIEWMSLGGISLTAVLKMLCDGISLVTAECILNEFGLIAVVMEAMVGKAMFMAFDVNSSMFWLFVEYFLFSFY